jgi:hypothetical protein
MSLDGIKFPEVDQESITEDQEKVLGFLEGAARGEVDSVPFNEIPLTTTPLDGTIVGIQMINRKKGDHVAFPVILIRVKTGEWTASNSLQTSPGWGSMFTLRFLHRALGPNFDKVQKLSPEDLASPDGFRKKLEYFDNLSQLLRGQSVKVRIKKQKNDPEYNDWSLTYSS